MRDFTAEEKELIVNTPITIESFEKWEDYHYEQIKIENFPYSKEKQVTCFLYPTTVYESLARYCEEIRFKYLETKNEHYFDILIHLLPNTYKVVKL